MIRLGVVAPDATPSIMPASVGTPITPQAVCFISEVCFRAPQRPTAMALRLRVRRGQVLLSGRCLHALETIG